MEMSKKIYLLRTENNLTQSEFAKIAGATDKAVSSWEKGTRSPKLQYTKPICEHFGIDLNTFIDESNDIYKPVLPSNAIPIDLTSQHRIPILGRIAAGLPLYAEQNIEGYTLTDLNGGAEYFALRVSGDSMEPRICLGDLVLIRKQNTADNGQIVAARVNGDEATLKRYKRQGDTVLLLPENQKYNPYVILVSDFENGYAQIFGVVVELRRTI